MSAQENCEEDAFIVLLDKGGSFAQWFIGNCWIGNKNDTEAMTWYRKAAEQGYVFLAQIETEIGWIGTAAAKHCEERFHG